MLLDIVVTIRSTTGYTAETKQPGEQLVSNKSKHCHRRLMKMHSYLGTPLPRMGITRRTSHHVGHCLGEMRMSLLYST